MLCEGGATAARYLHASERLLHPRGRQVSGARPARHGRHRQLFR